MKINNPKFLNIKAVNQLNLILKKINKILLIENYNNLKIKTLIKFKIITIKKIINNIELILMKYNPMIKAFLIQQLIKVIFIK